jgi:Protein kinase domain/Domain of unknown function (DUF4384)
MSESGESPSGYETKSMPSALPTDVAFLRPAERPDEMGRLGGFRILRELGHGGMGWVMLAEDPMATRQVAMKVMRPELARRADYRNRFLREARAAASLHDDNIVPIYQVGEDNGGLFFTMPLLSGCTLQQRLDEDRPTEIPMIVQVGREVAAGLATAHEHGLIHRDIKPANLWLEKLVSGQRIKLLDFGLARPVDEPGNTHPDVILGTPGYMAPEQILGSDLDGRCDLFSLGCVLYRMATGNAPFKGKTTAASLCSTLESEPAQPRSLRPDLPIELEQLIVSLLAKDPKDRPSSAREVADALGRIDAGETAAYVRPTPRSSGRTRALAAGLFALVLGVAAAIAFGLHSQKPEPLPEPDLAIAEAPVVAPDPVAALRTHFDVRIWREHAAVQGLPVTDPAALPLRKGDKVRIEASANRPAYFYLVCQDSKGDIWPLYPWVRLDWQKRGIEKPLQSLNLPEEIERGFPLDESPTGTEAIVLLARERPLDAAENLALMRAFKKCEGIDKEPPLQGTVTIAGNDRDVAFSVQEDRKTRGKPNFTETDLINDSVQRLRSALATSIRPLFENSRALCYPFQGKEIPPKTPGKGS